MTDTPDLQDFINTLRFDFSKDTLDEKFAEGNPFFQFKKWFAEAADLHEPNAMVISTATADGRPSSRVVLLRGFDENGFVFFTNYDSRKGSEIAGNPHVSLLFYWAELEKQIRIEGVIEKAPAETSDEYFASRPRESRIGAIASPQSSVLKDRAELEHKFAELSEELRDQEVTRPANWGGYVVKPEVFEFWQGRNSRLHDRLRYTKENDGWKIERLAP